MRELQKNENKLLKRVEILIEENLNVKPTISKKEVLEKISKKYEADKSLIVINSIKNSFKSDKCIVDFFIYKNIKDLEDLTLKHLIKRNQKNVENKTEEALKGEVEEEKPSSEEAKNE